MSNMDESGRDDSKDILVGRLIRSYRDDVRRKGRRLSQDGLIDLMVERGEESADSLDRSSVSRWESGARRAPREFLVAFGRALDIPKGEMDTMLSLAGYDSLREEERRDAILSATQRIETQMESIRRDVRSIADSNAEAPVDTVAVVRSALWKIGPPGMYALVVGFVLNAMDLNGTLALLAYVVFSLAIVVGQGALRWLKRGPDRPERDQVVDLLFISLFFTLNTPLLIGALTKSDHFGFYTFDTFTNTPMPFLFTILVNLALSLVASVMFRLLWDRRHGMGSFSHAVWTTLPPILFVYANIFVFTNLSNWIYFMLVLGTLFGAFVIIVALNEPEFELRDSDFVFRTVIVAIILLCSFGAVGTLLAQREPNIMITGAFYRIIPLPEISPEELGYTAEQGVERLRLGSLWMGVANMLYLVTVVGGYLIATIRRVSNRNP